jgi:hypothetical protein
VKPRLVSLRGAARLLALAGALAFALPFGQVPARAAAPLQAEQDALQAYEEARRAVADERLDEAELLLERVLMLMPEHAGARLDFALLLARRGQADAARALILSLARDPRTPPAYSVQLRALAARVGATPGQATLLPPANGQPAESGQALPVRSPEKPIWRAELGVAGSTNPLSRASADGVVLTLPDGPVTLPLGTRPQAGAVAAASLLRVQGSGGWDVSIQGMDSSGAATAYRAAVWGSAPVPIGVGLPPLQWQLQTLRGFDNLRRHSAALTAPLAGGAQRLVLGAYAEPAQQDRGWVLRAEHRAAGPVGLQWQASAERSGSTARPQGHWRLNLALEAPLGSGRRVQAQATAQQDTHPYSPLLGNTTRRLLTTYVGLEQQLPLAPSGAASPALVLRAFASRRASNLSLFAFQDDGAQAVLVWQW